MNEQANKILVDLLQKASDALTLQCHLVRRRFQTLLAS